ncbi:hypothetical protein [Sphingomonas flavalba]|uniref:hypothetical protein n=1 Tax=Sphingomonas flavalba TaxID=2559804 RepID=UPI003B8304B1
MAEPGAGAKTPAARAARRVETAARARVPRAHEWTGEKRALFLETLTRTLNISASARAAGMSTVSARALKRRDPGFAEAWAEAMLTFSVDLDLVPALSEDRERLWKALTAADFLSDAEKREMLGFDNG